MAARKIRKDSTVKAAEKRLGIKNAYEIPMARTPEATSLLGTLRKQQQTAKKNGKKK
jgi:hypothetical protein